MRDLRGLLWSSIDNADSRDLDQVEFAEQLPSGEIRLLVGIADVDAFVPAGVGDRSPRFRQRNLGLHRRGDISDAAGAPFD